MAPSGFNRSRSIRRHFVAAYPGDHFFFLFSNSLSQVVRTRHPERRQPSLALHAAECSGRDRLHPFARVLTLDAMLGDRHHGELRSYWGMGVPKAGDCEVVSWFLVPGTGLEPVRPCGPSILSALCLPVSPPGQAIDCNGVGARHGAASGVHWDGGRGIASRGTLFARRRGRVLTRQPGSHGASFSNGAGSGHHPP